MTTAAEAPTPDCLVSTASGDRPDGASTSPFFSRLAPELRNRIYRFAFSDRLIVLRRERREAARPRTRHPNPARPDGPESKDLHRRPRVGCSVFPAGRGWHAGALSFERVDRPKFKGTQDQLISGPQEPFTPLAWFLTCRQA